MRRLFLAMAVAFGVAGVASADSAALSWGQIKRGVTIIPQKIAPRVWGTIRIDANVDVVPIIRQEVKSAGKTMYILLADLKTRGIKPIFVQTALGDMVAGFAGEVEFDSRIEQPARYLLVYHQKGMTGEYRAWDKMLDENVPVGEVVWVAVLVGAQHFTPTLSLGGVKWKEL